MPSGPFYCTLHPYEQGQSAFRNFQMLTPLGAEKLGVGDDEVDPVMGNPLRYLQALREDSDEQELREEIEQDFHECPDGCQEQSI